MKLFLGYGYIIRYGSADIVNLVEGFGCIENATNNTSEYSGLIEGLRQALLLNVKCVIIHGDSLLVVNHIKNIYHVNSILLPYYQQVRELLGQFRSYEISHIDRAYNGLADQLARKAVTTNNYLTCYYWQNIIQYGD